MHLGVRSTGNGLGEVEYPPGEGAEIHWSQNMLNCDVHIRAPQLRQANPNRTSEPENRTSHPPPGNQEPPLADYAHPRLLDRSSRIPATSGGTAIVTITSATVDAAKNSR